jgi:hypothetical protein
VHCDPVLIALNRHHHRTSDIGEDAEEDVAIRLTSFNGYKIIIDLAEILIFLQLLVGTPF